jgi:CHAT domain-containing protein/tetratricopeptide (TPR) repeat protein
LIGCSKTAWQDPAVTYKAARQQFERGDLLSALAIAKEARAQVPGPDSEWSWRFRLLEAEIRVWQGRSREALDLLSDDPPESFAVDDLEIQRQMYRAMSYARLGQMQVAASALEKAQGLADRTHSSLQDELFSIRGIVDLQSGDIAGAESMFQRGLTLARQQRDKFLESTILLNRAVVALNGERYDAALSWSNSASEIARAIDARLILEKALGNAGWAFYELGDFEKALTNLEQARAEAGKLGATSDEVRWSNDSGAAQYDLGNLKAAEVAYKESLALAQSLQNREGVIIANINLASLLFQQKDFSSAAKECDSALQLAESGKSMSLEAWPLLLRGRLLAHQGRWKDAESTFLDVDQRSETPFSVRWQIENALAKTYEDGHDSANAELWYRKSISTFEQQRSSVKNEESRLPFFTNATDLYRDYADYLIAHQRPTEALALLDVGRARTLEEDLGIAGGENPAAASRPVQAQSVAARLKATILFYALGREKSYLWAVSPTSTRFFELPDEAMLAGHVRSYQRTILRSEDPLRTENADATYLYRTLVAPAQPLLPENGRVFIIADGCLDGLNFETLLVPSSSGAHYWIEDATITIASSLRLLSTAPTPTKSNGPQKSGAANRRFEAEKLLLIGDPISPSQEYPALPNASAEIADIEQHFPNDERVTLTRSRAVPAAYFASKPEQYTYIHFVSHGTASRLSPLDSAVVLSAPDAAPYAQPDSFKLYAREIARQPLRAELVTISSCYGSGTRVYAGEGIVGLSWAFLRAGSHNVIGSLWEVSDASTPLLMDRMYGKLENAESPAEALRSAKLSLLHSEGTFRKPFYWAAFQLYSGAFVSKD